EDRVVVRDLGGVDDDAPVGREDDAEHRLHVVRPGGRLGQIEGHGLVQDDLRRDHEDDEQHQRDVDQRGHVDPRDALVGRLQRRAARHQLRSVSSPLGPAGVAPPIPPAPAVPSATGTALRCARSMCPRASVFATVPLTTRWNALNAATAGMAIMMPTAVATRASEMRAMTASGASCVAAAPAAALLPLLSSSNAATMPMTVPRSPMKGALLPRVPRKARRFSSLPRCKQLAPSIASSAARTPRSASTSPPTTTPASALPDSSTRRRPPSISP